jgi:beta-galactosidase
LDIQGFNYQDGVYDAFHGEHPTTPMLATETASNNEDRGEYNDTNYMSSFDTSQEVWWGDQVGRGKPGWQKGEDLRPFMMGGFDWTGFDYKGECQWPSVNSHFGALDHAGFWKDRAWWYAAAWKPSEPLLHIFPGWSHPALGLLKSLIYSNADSVACTVVPTGPGPNISLPVIRVPPLRHGVLVPPDDSPASGTLHCMGYVNGTAHSELILPSAGAAASLSLTVEMGQTQLRADGQDVALLRLEVLDSHGVRVPSATNNVSFTATGPAGIIGVGNGDPHCHEPDKGTWRSAFHGLARAIVQSDRQGATGSVVIEAHADGLASSRITLNAVAPTPTNS